MYNQTKPGTPAPTSTIVGYRVLYQQNGNQRLMSFKDSKGRMRTVFPNFGRAATYMRHARYGSNPRMVPVFSKT